MNGIAMPADRQAEKVYRVSELAALLRHTLEETFGCLWVEGEVSNLRTPASGHAYFTVKDEQSALRAVFFRGDRRNSRIDLAEGQKVRVFAQVSVYPVRGDLQLIVRRMQAAGRGSLQEAFEKLKARLAAEGLFNADRKQPLPVLPRSVGIVTSRTGAALQDILNVMGRRFPNLHIVLSPAAVQGQGAAAELVAALERLQRFPGIDAIIIGRGGGSLEDLWPFNEEIVARAVAACPLPVIAAVGHETDWSICDFVADVRAPTPSAAAELVVGRKQAFEEQLRQSARRLEIACRHGVLRQRQRLTAAAGSYVFHEPRHAVRLFRQRIDRLTGNLTHAARRNLQFTQQQLDDRAVVLRQTLEKRRSDDRLRLADAAGRLRYAASRGLQEVRGHLQDRALRLRHPLDLRLHADRQRLAALQSQMKALDPRAVLGRGYSITRDEQGRVLTDPARVAAGNLIETELAGGRLQSRVTDPATAPGSKGDNHDRKED